ncbi:Uncharacterised protein [Bordetella trematum]|uniref:Uncharacterized protein n=2 Tax=Bordetella trematum TaxID=123899 RepID=A0A157SHX3_9BORD|nr:Uncharacterised protein [Bordetella trematum]SAI33280.1 Uncharacterised protein [Bordetella trematum]SAI69773.1 Uncharacterised protein [Bordetella trematum]SUV99114.1 Uncharacterised protein [Bordetella trematum]
MTPSMMLFRCLLIAGMALPMPASVQAKPRSPADHVAGESVVAQCHALMAAHDFDNVRPVCQQAVAVLAASAEGKAQALDLQIELGALMESPSALRHDLARARSIHPSGSPELGERYLRLGHAENLAGDPMAARAALAQGLTYPGLPAAQRARAVHLLAALYERNQQIGQAIAVLEGEAGPDGSLPAGMAKAASELWLTRIRQAQQQAGKAEVEWLRRRWALLEQMVASGEARRYRNEGTMDCILPDPPPPRRLSEEGDTLLEFQMGTDAATLPQLHVRQTSGVASVDRIAFGIGERMQCLPGVKAIRFRLPVALRLPSASGTAAAAP